MRLTGVRLVVDDVVAELAFYRRGLTPKVIANESDRRSAYAMLQDERETGGWLELRNSTGVWDGPAEPVTLVFVVEEAEDVDASVAALVESGGTIVVPPHVERARALDARSAQVRDPAGTLLELRWSSMKVNT